MTKIAIKRRLRANNVSAVEKRTSLVNDFSGYLKAQLIVTSILCGVLFAFSAVLAFGKWLPPAHPVIVAGVGSLEAIRMPKGARKLEDIGSLVVIGGNGDDFGRVYVNNYLIKSGENPDSIFFTQSSTGQKARDLVSSHARRRNNFMIADKDASAYLKRGDNYIIHELENSIFSTCMASLRLEVNGTLIEHFPQTVPLNFFVEPGVSNELLALKMDASGVGALSDAICSRRIYHFYLE